MKYIIVMSLLLMTNAIQAQSNKEIKIAEAKLQVQEQKLALYNKEKLGFQFSKGHIILGQYINKSVKKLQNEDLDSCSQIRLGFWEDCLLAYTAGSSDLVSSDNIKTSSFTDIWNSLKTIKSIAVIKLQDCNQSIETLNANWNELKSIIESEWLTEVKVDNTLLSSFAKTNTNLKKLRSLQNVYNAYEGSASFSFSGNTVYETETRSNDQYNFNIGMNLDKGLYPGEFNFSGSLGLTVNGESFEESITNVDISYDRAVSTDDHPLMHEIFGFVSRSSNSYLDISQRYEAGAGYIINFFSQKLTPKGTEIKEMIDGMEVKSGPANAIVTCSSKLCTIIPNMSKIDTNDIKAINKHIAIGNAINRKKYAQWRSGLLLGAILEFEEITTPDSITLTSSENPESTKEIKSPFTFAHTIKPRFEIRPFIEGRFQDQFYFKLKPYFLIPLKWNEIYVEEEFDDGSSIKKLDIRMNLVASLSMVVDQVSIGVKFNYVRDNSPRYAYFNESGSPFSGVYLSPHSHLNTTISFGYTFN